MYVAEPTFADPGTEDALEAIGEALTLAYKALSWFEWETWDLGDLYCIWCGNGRHVGHDSRCKRQLALASIRVRCSTSITVTSASDMLRFRAVP